MTVTKYEHACIDITEGNTRLIIDPGVFSKSLTDYSNVNAVVVTHNHADHFDKETLHKIVNFNPDVRILTTKQVITDFTTNTELAKRHQDTVIGDIRLKFFGDEHFLFSEVQNVGVLVNDTLYYPGDSYTLPDTPVKLLATPASAPWFRIDEGKEFLKKVNAPKVFPTHNAPLSDIGESIHYRLLSETCKEIGSEWLVLKPGESIEV